MHALKAYMHPFTPRIVLKAGLVCRLPHLESLRVGLDKQLEAAVPEPGYLALFFELVRIHLPSLASVTLVFNLDNVDWEEHTALWDILVKFSQLQTLHIEFSPPEHPQIYWHYRRSDPNLRLNDLQRLSSLSSLSSLTVSAPDIIPQQDYSFLCSLTNLTHLQLPLALSSAEMEVQPLAPPPSRLLPFTALTKLQSLALVASNRPLEPPLTAADCSALAQLTSLTTLELEAVRGLGSEGLLQQLLTPLQQLQVLQLPNLKPSFALPVLAGLMNLRELSTEWEEERQVRSRGASSGMACPSVKRLTCTGIVPAEAFPEVRVASGGIWRGFH